MKRIICIVLCLLMLCGALCSCGDMPVGNDKMSIVTTIFPVYDWVRQILGENNDEVQLTLLMDNGVDLHSYQPTAEDMIKISSCDVFIYVGGLSDKWADDALKTSVNPDMTVINIMDVLGDSIKEEEIVEGMQGEEEENDDEIEYDEHIWLSVKNAETACSAIAEQLAKADSQHGDIYRANAESYIEKLGALDKEYEAAVNESTVKTLLFADRFPFRYMADDYGLDYYAAFVGCSAETEASFETISFLTGKLDELNLNSVLVTESSDGRIAETIIKSAQNKQKDTVIMDSMQSVTSDDIEQGETYLAIMQGNLQSLKQALK